MNPHDRIDTTRCVIVKPGDVLILSGIRIDTDELAAGLTRLREDMGLRRLIVCERLDELSVRDIDAELAKAEESVETYRFIAENQLELARKVQDDLDAAREEIRRLKTAN